MKIVATSAQRKIIPTANQTTYEVESGAGDIQLKLPKRIINAADYGFDPDASAAVNVAAWNSMPGDCEVRICIPGVYEINSTLYLRGDTTYRFCEGITIKKTGLSFCQVFANDAYAIGLRNENIYLYGSGLVINVNSNETEGSPAIPYMKGQISIYQCDSFIIDDIYCNTIGTNQYFCMISDVNDFQISNLYIEGNKDGVDLVGPCSNGIIKYVTTKTADDGIFIGGAGYAGNLPQIGEISNISLLNYSDLQKTGQGGNAIRIPVFSWSIWTLGNSYQKAEPCVNNGKIYVKQNDGSAVAVNAPVHTSGIVTGADGISWRFMKYGTETEANVTNILIKDCTSSSSRRFLLMEIPNADANWIGASPGTYGNAYIENLIIDNASFTNDSPNSTRFYFQGKVKSTHKRRRNWLLYLRCSRHQYPLLCNPQFSTFLHILEIHCYKY